MPRTLPRDLTPMEQAAYSLLVETRRQWPLPDNPRHRFGRNNGRSRHVQFQRSLLNTLVNLGIARWIDDGKMRPHIVPSLPVSADADTLSV